MDINNDEIGVRYEVKKLEKNTFLLIPIDIESGYTVGDMFYTNKKQYPILTDKNSLNKNYVIDNIFTLDELKDKMSYYEDDLDFVKDYFLLTEKDNIILINTSNNKISKRVLDIKTILTSSPKEIYEKIKNGIIVTLNQDSLDNIINIEDIEILKKELYNLRRKIQEFEKESKNKSVNRIIVEKGHIKEIETEQMVEKKAKITSNTKISNEVSLQGLENYIKERVFGHDEEIRHIAKTLIMNYTAIGEEKIEPILLVGPTGVGKTETMNAGAEYLGIPYVEVNTINLVPQGIKGESLEDILYSLLVESNYELDKAQRALIFLDEFDKLGSSNTDYKQAVKDILLKFIEGGKFVLDKSSDDCIFNTKYLNKVFAGRFKEAFNTDKTLGFTTESTKKELDLVSLLSDKAYYGKELITRIKHIYLYKELDRETKKRILLESKLSEYLQKRLRYERQFGITLEAKDSYIDAILEKLDKNKQSIRELNNLVSSTLEEVEYTLLSSNNQGKRLILTQDIVEDNKNFTLL